MIETTELAAKLKAAIRGEGEPGHPGEMISVVEAEYLIDEVFAGVEAAPSDPRETGSTKYTHNMPEAAPSDTDREALTELVGVGMADRGNYVIEWPRDEIEAYRACDGSVAQALSAARAVQVRNAADRILAAGFSRTSQPVQVEVTAAMREKALAEWGRQEPGSVCAPADSGWHEVLVQRWLACRSVCCSGWW